MTFLAVLAGKSREAEVESYSKNKYQDLVVLRKKFLILMMGVKVGR